MIIAPAATGEARSRTSRAQGEPARVAGPLVERRTRFRHLSLGAAIAAISVVTSYVGQDDAVGSAIASRSSSARICFSDALELCAKRASARSRSGHFGPQRRSPRAWLPHAAESERGTSNTVDDRPSRAEDAFEHHGSDRSLLASSRPDLLEQLRERLRPAVVTAKFSSRAAAPCADGLHPTEVHRFRRARVG